MAIAIDPKDIRNLSILEIGGFMRSTGVGIEEFSIRNILGGKAQGACDVADDFVNKLFSQEGSEGECVEDRGILSGPMEMR